MGYACVSFVDVMMLTKIRIQNFKQFDDVEIELGPVTVLIGPNNSGKTTILQALMLWHTGCQEWLEAYGKAYDGLENTLRYDEISEQQAINRLDLMSMTVPTVSDLWLDTKTKNSHPTPIVIELWGTDLDEQEISSWTQQFEFLFANDQSMLCFDPKRSVARFYFISSLWVHFLPPMSGISAVEDQLQRGAIDRRIGEGRTSEIIRNICFRLDQETIHWQKVVNHMQQLFGVEILPPQYIVGRGELRMSYRDQQGIIFDIASAGRGMLQMLLLLAYMYDNPGSVLLLDEPDAHLEILRQREVYVLLAKVAKELGSQIIIATHSEVIMNAAGDKDVLIAFVGKPHRIDNNSTSQKDQIAKALNEYGHDQYFLALQRQWVLYLEGETDLAILKTFADVLNHPSAKALNRPFTKFVGNVAKQARDHFYALHEALNSLKGIVILDRPYATDPSKQVSKKQRSSKPLPFNIFHWERNEIENYLWQPETLLAYAQSLGYPNAVDAMETTIKDRFPLFALNDRQDEWWKTTKASEFLTAFFKAFFARLNQYNAMDKSSFYVLARYVPVDLIDPEIIEKLDAIWDIAKDAPNT